MAIAPDATGVGPNDTATSLTWSHTCTGANRLLVVAFGTNGTVSSVTYDGVAMTVINSSAINGAPGFSTYLYYLLAPATGANDVVVTCNASATIAGASASYTGVKPSDQPDASAAETNVNATNYARAVTTVAEGCWVVMVAQNVTGAVSAGASTTVRQQASGQNFAIADSNAAVSPAGERTLTVTVGGAANWNSVIASFAPAFQTSMLAVF